MGTPPSCAPVFASSRAAMKPGSVSIGGYNFIVEATEDENAIRLPL